MGIAAFKVFMVVDTGRDYPHMPGIGVHDHGDLLRDLRDDRPDRAAADGPPARPGADDRTSRSSTGSAASATSAPTPRPTPPTTGSSGTPPRRSCSGSSRRPGTPLHLLHTQTTRRDRPAPRGQGRGPGRLGRDQPMGRLPRQRLADHRAARLVRAVVLRAGDRTPSRSGRRSATGPSTSCRPTTRRTLREEKEPGWTDGWKAHTGTPSAQFYVSLLLDASAHGPDQPRAGRRRDRDRPGSGLRARRQGSPRGRRRRRHRDRRPRRRVRDHRRPRPEQDRLDAVRRPSRPRRRDQHDLARRGRVRRRAGHRPARQGPPGATDHDSGDLVDQNLRRSDPWPRVSDCSSRTSGSRPTRTC